MVSVSLSRLLVVAPVLVLGVARSAAAQTPIKIGDINSYELMGSALAGSAGSPIAPGVSGPRAPAGQAEGACRASGMLVKQNPAPLRGRHDGRDPGARKRVSGAD